MREDKEGTEKGGRNLAIHAESWQGREITPKAKAPLAIDP